MSSLAVSGKVCKAASLVDRLPLAQSSSHMIYFPPHCGLTPPWSKRPKGFAFWPPLILNGR
jgi:hypothetical protein